MSVPHQRRPHKNSKKGCITCKARKVKCTEEHPACHRCLSTGRVCGGYTPKPNPAAPGDPLPYACSSPGSAQNLLPKTTLSPYFGGSMSPLELRALQFFRNHTIPSLCGFYESDIWNKLVLQISHSEPGLRHAMIAIGRLHEWSGLHGIPAIDFVEKNYNETDQMEPFAIAQYMKAVPLIRARLATGDGDDIVALVACLLFMCLEILRGERKAANAHLKSGLDILKTRNGQDPSETIADIRIPVSLKSQDVSDLAEIFARMGFFGTCEHLPRSDPDVGSVLLDLPKRDASNPFESVEEARAAFTNIYTETLYFKNAAKLGKLLTGDLSRMQNMAIHKRLTDWSNAFEPFLSRERFNRHPPIASHERGIFMLRAALLVHEICADIFLQHGDEWRWDLHLESFKTITYTVESVVNLTNPSQPLENPLSSNFTLNQGLVTTLFMVAIKCRDPITRRRAIAALYKSPRREGVWDAVQRAKIAEVIMAVEEDTYELPTDDVWSPGWTRAISYDIGLRSEIDPNRQLLTLRMIRKDGSIEPEPRVHYLCYDDGVDEGPSASHGWANKS